MNKKALVTGASSGIGREFAFKLAAAGYDLAIVARRENRLAAIKRDIEAKYQVTVEFLKTDLTKGEDIERMFGQFPKVDLLVNDAGVGTLGDFIETDREVELNIINVNIVALYRLTKFYASQMTKSGGGGIINVASMAAFGPLPRFGVYAASKSFVLSFTESIAFQLKEKGIRVLAVCPGPTETEFWDAANIRLEDRPARMDDPSVVVREALQAYNNGKELVITGWRNRVQLRLARILPRVILKKIISKFI